MPISAYTATIVRLGEPLTGPGWESRPLVTVPEGASRESCLWRMAQAAVTVDGEWSPLPGKKRFVVVTSGEGFQLIHHATSGGITRKFLGLFSIYPFSGGDTTNCKLTAGPCTDVNLMIDEARIEAAMEVFPPNGKLTKPPPLTVDIPLVNGTVPVDFYLLYCVSGVFTAKGVADTSPSIAQGTGLLLTRRSDIQPPGNPSFRVIGRGDHPIAIGARITRLVSEG